MDIGKPVETVVVEPIEIPVPGEPDATPAPPTGPAELPLDEPAREPVSV